MREKAGVRTRVARRSAAAAAGVAVVAVFSGFLAAASPRAAATGLVAAYAFDAGSGTTAADASGNNNNGTISGATWTTSGKFGNALSFNGTNARVNIPNAASLQLTTGMTLEAWVRPTTVANAWRDVIYKGDDNYYLMGTTDHSSHPGGGAIVGGSYGEVFYSSALPTATWSHLALTYDGGTLRFYVNGALASSLAKTGAIKTSTNQLSVGGDSLYGQFFNGLIDEVRVYNRALSAAEIQTDMTTAISGAGDTTPPSAPGTLTANAVSAGEIDLSWGAATDNVGVAGYQIFRCQSSGCSNYTQVGTASGTTYKDTSVAASTSYGFEVRAVDAAANSGPFSNAATATTSSAGDTTPPSAPGTLTANAVSAGEIDLSWGAATDNVGVAGYQIFRCQSSGCSNYTQVGTASGTTYKDTSVAASTSYGFEVRAVDAAANSGPFSNAATATTSSAGDTTPPSAPGTLTANAVSAGEIDLSWGAATDNVGVTGYQIFRCQSSGCNNYTQAGTATGTSYSDTGLQAGTSYGYEVRAVDAAANTGPFSNAASALTTPVTTDLVASYSFDEGGGTTVGDSSGHNNNGTITGATWTTVGKFGNALSFNGTNARINIPNSASLQLTSGMTLEAWVRPATVANAWRDVIYKGDDNYYLMGSTDHGAASGGGGIIGGSYGEVFHTTSLPTATWSHLALTYDGATLRLYLNGTNISSLAKTGAIKTSTNQLSIGGDSLYGQYFNGLIDEVRVYDTPLAAADIAEDMATPIGGAGGDVTPPSAPGAVTATAASSSEIDLSWGAATDNIAVAGYQIVRCQGASCTNFASAGTSTGTSFKDTGLLPNTSYSYQVRAVDGAGNLGSASNTASATTLASSDITPPSAPTGLVATPASSNEIDLGWTPATDNVGVTGYRIDRCQGGGCTDFSHLTEFAGTQTTYKDVGLLPSTSYSYQVKALDAAGNLGPASAAATTTTQPSPPPGLVAAYSFDEGSGTTVSDASGNNNNGTLANATWSTNGKFGGALSFNGTNARVNVPNSVSLQLTTGMTLEAWVDPAVVSSAWRDVIYKGDDNYYLMGTTDHSSVPAGGAIISGSYGEVYNTTPLQANTWSHLALTYDGSMLRLYLNGTLVASQPKTGSITTSTNQLQIGGDGIYGQYFNGRIDEVRIYNAALSGPQIQADMAAGLAAPSVPGSLMATPITSTRVDLSWNAVTDAAGITGYKVERCQGQGCNSFTQIAAPTGATYSDTGLTANTSYTYRVRAIDSAGKLGGYSDIATAYTGVEISPRQVALTPGQTQQFTAVLPGGGSTTVTWSVDGIAGGSSSVGIVTSTGLYTAPSGVGNHMLTATPSDGSGTVSSTVYITNYAGTFTFHNDNLRTGRNVSETVLSPANVNVSSFGRLASIPLDGIAYASPLYVEHVSIPGQGFHNVVYVATEHGTVYAFDADNGSSTPLWKTSFIDPAHGITTVPAGDTGECCDIAPEIGITGTPVIDPSTNTLYVVMQTKEIVSGSTSYAIRLHALDLTTGAEKLGAPIPIQPSVPGSGAGSVNGTLTLDQLHESEHSALLLLNGVVYIAFSAHGDYEPYHGWIVGYNANTLQQTMVFNLTPNTTDAGVWMGGSGIASDAAGALYYISGDGPFDGASNWGDSYIRMTTGGLVTDWFTPFNQAALYTANHDLGSSGPLLLPDQPGAHPHEMVGAGKDGTIYVVDRDNMGHYSTSTNNVVQQLPNAFPPNSSGGSEPGNFSSPVYFNGTVFFAPNGDNVQGFTLTNGLLSTTPTYRSAAIFPDRGAAMAVSASGTSNGILWVMQRNSTNPGVLYAYDLTNSSGGTLKELYDSSQAGTRDTAGVEAKWDVPLVANGKVFVGGTDRLSVYGLRP